MKYFDHVIKRAVTVLAFAVKAWARERGAGGWLALVLACAVLLGAPCSSSAVTPEYLADEESAPASADQLPSPLSESFQEPPPRRYELEPLRDAAREMPAFIRDSDIAAKIRTYYFDRQVENGDRRQALAFGGMLSLRTGWAADRVQFGAAFYTSQPLYAPDDRDGSLLLAPGQEAISILGQAYVRLKLVEGTDLTVYRQEVDLPFLNRQDSRMVPNTFEGVMLRGNTWESLKFVAGHLTAMKTRGSNGFRPMSRAAGLAGGDRGLSLGGMLVSLGRGIDWGFVDQYSWDFQNTFYTEANWAWKGATDASCKLSAQYARQESVGDALGGEFETGFGGARLSAGWGGAVASLAFTMVGSGGPVLSPFGGYPGYTSLQVCDFDRAEEKAWLLGLSYDLSRLGAHGIGVFANYARGNTPDHGTNASPDEQEFNLTIDWRPEAEPWRGLWLRLRAAHVQEDNGPTTNEFQLILNYELDLL